MEIETDDTGKKVETTFKIDLIVWKSFQMLQKNSISTSLK